MSALKTWKSILEIRYPAAASLFDNRGEIATYWQWKDDLSEWQISNNQVTVFNKSNTKFLRVGLRNAVVVYELPESQKAFLDRAEEFVLYILETLQPKSLERVGLRIILVSERKHFKLLVNNIRKRLLSLTEADWAIFGGPPDDVGFPLVLTLEEYKVNFNFGPMAKDQLAGYFESNEVKERLPAVCLFCDFDIFRTDLNLEANLQASYFRDFLKFGSDQALQISRQFLDKYKDFE